MLIRTLIYTLRLIAWVRFFLGLNVEVRDIVAFFVPMSILVVVYNGRVQCHKIL